MYNTTSRNERTTTNYAGTCSVENPHNPQALPSSPSGATTACVPNPLKITATSSTLPSPPPPSPPPSSLACFSTCSLARLTMLLGETLEALYAPNALRRTPPPAWVAWARREDTQLGWWQDQTPCDQVKCSSRRKREVVVGWYGCGRALLRWRGEEGQGCCEEAEVGELSREGEGWEGVGVG